MTDEEALAEARRRWGPHAHVMVELTTCLELFLVGVADERTGEPAWHGAGRSWEAAFREADLPGRAPR